MKTLVVNPELASEMSVLTESEYSYLEQTLKNEGCRDSLVIWGNTLIDGHNRYKICVKHDISFNTISKDFKNLEEAREWMIRNQLSRRNLNAWEKVKLAKRLEPVLKEKAKKNQALGGGEKVSGKAPRALSATWPKALDVRAELAAASGISERTIARANYIQKHRDVAPDLVEKLDKGDAKVTINSAYRAIKNIVSPPKPRLKRRFPKGYMDVHNLTLTQLMNIANKAILIFEMQNNDDQEGVERQMRLLKALLTS
jgi:hypothetical protein